MRKARHLLIADDDEEDRDILGEAIRELDPSLAVSFAKNGLDLLEQLEFLIPDLVFLDINMPMKTGMECLADIRANKQTSQLPVIVYSTTASEKYVNLAFAAGANLFIQKPSNYTELKRVLSSVISLDLQDYPPGENRPRFLHQHNNR